MLGPKQKKEISRRSLAEAEINITCTEHYCLQYSSLVEW